MSQSYVNIDSGLANRIRLVMTDVDGTITDFHGRIEGVAADAIRSLSANGVIVGFVSGRTLPRLDVPARESGIDGPIIGENGGIAKLNSTGELLDLGYSRHPALRDLDRLKALYPGAIESTEDDADRLVDVGFKASGVDTADLRKHLRESELLDSGYMLHLMQKGVSKGGTLMKILNRIGDGDLSPEEVVVVGDSPTDMSLFDLFPHSVLVLNSRVSEAGRREVESIVEFASELEFGAGFAQVAAHILGLRR
ncbi:MAG: HAD hydrolase family protein [Chloroflexota bacterium]|nr:HAD hydrolase family protein [Chloroflexota bacterium]